MLGYINKKKLRKEIRRIDFKYNRAFSKGTNVVALNELLDLLK